MAASSLTTVVLDAEAITQADTTATDELLKLDHELETQGIRFVFARLTLEVRAALESGGMDLEGRDYRRVTEAVAAAQ